MAPLLQKEIEDLNKRLFSLSTSVEESVQLAVRAVTDRRVELAELVFKKDRHIDTVEVEIEEECLKLLALHQPVASDLRRIVAALKINNDLERTGDVAVSISKRAVALAKIPPVSAPFDLATLSSKVQLMLRNSIDSVIRYDVDLAYNVLATDDSVNKLSGETLSKLLAEIKRQPEKAEQLVLLQSVSRNLERIGDLATNIAEDTIYLVKGEIIRHRWADN